MMGDHVQQQSLSLGEAVERKPLTMQEEQLLAEQERIIAINLKGFFAVGRALLTIRDNNLFRWSHRTFEDYCKDVWDLGRPRAYQMIAGYEVVENLSTIVDKNTDADAVLLPANEAQARPLAPLSPATRAEAWQIVMQLHEEGEPITARLVQQAVNQVFFDRVEREVARAKSGTSLETIKISPQLKKTCQDLLDEIEREAHNNWRGTDKKVLADHLRPILDAIESN